MKFTALKNHLDRMVAEYNIPGVDCSVYKEHKEIFRYCTGYADIEEKRLLKQDDLYIIFSMSKMLTVTGALQLLEKGKYAMHDPVSKYLPEFEKMKLDVLPPYNDEYNVECGKSGYAKAPILVRHLFTMTSGMSYNLADEAIQKALSEGKKTTRELVGAMAGMPLGFEPGTRFRYSLSHDVLGALIEVWSGQKFSDYMRENVFAPLGMKETFFGLPKDSERKSRITSRYQRTPEGKLEKQPYGCRYILTDEYECGGAGLVSRVDDYAIFLDALANGGMAANGYRLLSPSTVELMGMNHLSERQVMDLGRAGYGYGLGVRSHIDKTKSGSLSPIGEFGWDGAAGAFSLVDTKNKLSMAYFQEMHGWELRWQYELRNVLYSCLEL